MIEKIKKLFSITALKNSLRAIDLDELRRIITQSIDRIKIIPFRKKIIISVSSATALIVTVILITAAGADPSNNLNPGTYSEPPVPDDSYLQVVQATPQGKISIDDTRKEVYIVFNHPLVPLAQLEDKTTGVFEITPKAQGRFRWYGSRVCAFVPEKGWTPGTQYTVTVRAGLTSLNKKALQKDHISKFKIETPPLRITSYPYTGRRIDYDQDFTLNFNFPVDLNMLNKYLAITSQSGKHGFRLSYSRKDDNEINRKEVIVDTQGTFPRNGRVVLAVKKGFRSADPVTELKSDEKIEYMTHGPLTVELKGNANYYQDLWEVYFDFNNKVDSAQARQAVIFSPQAKLRHYGRGKTGRIGLTAWDLKPGQSYRVKVSPFRDIYGNTLTGNTDFSITVPDYRPEYSIEYGKDLIESKMKQLYPVSVTNIGEMSVGVGEFDLKHILRDLDDNRYDIINNISLKTSVWKTGIGPNRQGNAPFNLAPYLSQEKTGWVGVQFSAEVVSYSGRREIEVASRLIQSTDLGITVKEGYDTSHVWVNSLNSGAPVQGAVVQLYDESSLISSCTTDGKGYCSIAKKDPVIMRKAVYLASRGNKDKAFVSTKNHTVGMYYLCNNHDEDAAKRKLAGQIIFDRKLYRPGDQVKIKGIMAVRVKGKLHPLKNTSMAVNISSSNGDSVYSETISTSQQGGLWADYTIPADAPLGHYGVTISLNKNSYVNDTFQVEEFRPASFSADVEGIRDCHVGEDLGLEITGSYLFGAPMQNAPVSYSFMRMKKRIHLKQYSDFTFGDSQLWDYEDEIDWSDAGYYTGDSGKLDGAGKYSFSLKPKPMLAKEKLTKPSAEYELSDIYDMKMEATVTDVDQKSVTKTKVFTVYPGTFLIGIKTADRYQNYANTFSFDIMAVSNKGERVGGKAVTLRIIKNTWKSIMTKGPGGTVQAKNTLVSELVQQSSMTISSDPSSFTFRPKEPGTYTITVQERGGYSYSRDGFYAFGGDDFSWYYHDDDSITLVPDKIEYEPGETAKVLVQSPFKNARAIITLERESVIWQKTIDLASGGTPISVPIKESYLPNVYLSVMLIRPRVNLPSDAEPDVKKYFIKNDLGIPKFKAGIVKLSVNNSSKRARLTVKTDKETYGPGDEVTVTLQSEPGAEIALSVADRGVLDLVEYEYADPVNKFFQNWPLGTRILENRRFLIKQYVFAQKGNSPGGQGKGDELEGIGGFDKDSEDGARKDIRYTAYWNPKITADKAGAATVTFKLPDNLTTFRIMALASADGKYRSLKREFKVRKAMVIQKNMPRFMRPGDTLRIGAVVINQTGIGGRFTFAIQSGLLKAKVTSKDIYVNAGEAKEVTFPVIIDLDKYAALKRQILAKKPEEQKYSTVEVKGLLMVSPIDLAPFTGAGFKKNDVTDKLQFTFPIREQPPEEAFTVAGFTTKESKEFVTFPGQEKIVEGMGGLDLTMSSSALVGLREAFNFYKTNPYFCLEQRASAFLLAITSGALLKEFSYKPSDEKGYDFGLIEELFLGELDQFQNADGGFRTWKTGSYEKSDPYLTAYVALILEIAREKGRSVSSGTLSKAYNYLRQYTGSPRKDGFSYILETFSLINYVMAMGDSYNSSLTSLLLENEKRLSLRARGYLALAIAEAKGISDYRKNRDTSRLMEYIKNRMEITTQKVSFSEENRGSFEQAFYSRGSTLGILLRVMIKLDRNNPLIPQIVNYMLADKKRTLWLDSHSAGTLALALQDYHEAFERDDSLVKSFTGKIAINQVPAAEKTFSRDRLEVHSVEIPFRDLYKFGKSNVMYPMTITNSAANRLYYSASLLYYPISETSKPRDEGIEVYRDLFDISSATDKLKYGPRVKDNLKRGTIYLCRLHLVVPKPCFSAVIVDPIPSNVEIVNTSFKTEKSSLSKYSTKERDKGRYYWWDEVQPIVEYRDDRVVITQDYLSPGMHEFFYLVRPVIMGSSAVPPATAKLMYEPEVFGRTGSGSMDVQ